MADIFTKANAQNLLRNKTIWLFGDSNVRGTYKDLVWLLQKNSLIDLDNLRTKLEKSHMNDMLIKGKKLERGRTYQEERRYHNVESQTTVEFVFLTKCLNEDIQNKLKEIRCHPKSAPNIVIMNSCLWDIVRWGPDGVSKYKRNIVDLMKLFRSSLPPSTLVIWTTTPPIAAEPSGGFLIKQIEFMKHTIRFEVMEANMFVRQEVVSHGFDILDIHYHLLLQIHRRRPDGIHWDTDAVRHITNLILTHIALAWGQELPGNFKSPIIDKMKSFVPEPLTNEKETIKELGEISKFLQPNDDANNNVNCSNSKNSNVKNANNGKGNIRNQRRKKNNIWSNKHNVVPNNNLNPNYDIWVNGDDFSNAFNQNSTNVNGWNNFEIDSFNSFSNNDNNGYNNGSDFNKEFNNRRYNNRKRRNYRPY